MTPGTGRPDGGRAAIVTAFLRDGDRVLLCHRSPARRRYPDVWDLPGGHVEPGEPPAAALVREVREELGVEIARPAGPPMAGYRTAEITMRIWLVEAWAGTPVNAAPQEHDAIAWFTAADLPGLRLAHEENLALFTRALTGLRA